VPTGSRRRACPRRRGPRNWMWKRGGGWRHGARERPGHMELVRDQAMWPAPAKLTLSLRITGVRHDGFHLLDAEMVTLDLADELWISEGEGLTVVAAATGAKVPAGPDNLVARALDAVGRRAAVRLVKHIPAGAGLGGGSADAAAVLRWAGVSDVGVAASLGADVPFCLAGGRARVTGIGEVIEPLPFVADRVFTLLTPPFGVSTPAVYRAWDSLGGPVSDGPNDLEPA